VACPTRAGRCGRARRTSPVAVPSRRRAVALVVAAETRVQAWRREPCSVLKTALQEPGWPCHAYQRQIVALSLTPRRAAAYPFFGRVASAAPSTVATCACDAYNAAADRDVALAAGQGWRPGRRTADATTKGGQRRRVGLPWHTWCYGTLIAVVVLGLLVADTVLHRAREEWRRRRADDERTAGWGVRGPGLHNLTGREIDLRGRPRRRNRAWLQRARPSSRRTTTARAAERDVRRATTSTSRTPPPDSAPSSVASIRGGVTDRRLGVGLVRDPDTLGTWSGVEGRATAVHRLTPSTRTRRPSLAATVEVRGGEVGRSDRRGCGVAGVYGPKPREVGWTRVRSSSRPGG